MLVLSLNHIMVLTNSVRSLVGIKVLMNLNYR